MLAFDPLIGLKSPQVLDQEVEAWFARSDWSCLHVNTDRLRRFMDYHGMPAGDARLIATARMLENALPDAQVYRSYADQFYCLLEKPLACATELARQIVAEARTLPVDWGYANTIGAPVCVAVAYVPTHASDWSALQNALSRSMYAAKFRGMSQVCVVQNENAR